jgi:hypothetical protein
MGHNTQRKGFQKLFAVMINFDRDRLPGCMFGCLDDQWQLKARSLITALCVNNINDCRDLFVFSDALDFKGLYFASRV